MVGAGASGPAGHRPPQQQHGRTQPSKSGVRRPDRQAGRGASGNRDGVQAQLDRSDARRHHQQDGRIGAVPGKAWRSVRASQALEALAHEPERLLRLEQRPRGRGMLIAMVDLLREVRGTIRRRVLGHPAGRARVPQDQVTGRAREHRARAKLSHGRVVVGPSGPDESRCGAPPKAVPANASISAQSALGFGIGVEFAPLVRADGLGIAGSFAPPVEPPSGLADTGGLGFGEGSSAPAATKAPPGPAGVAPPAPAASAPPAPAACAAIVQPRPRRARRSPPCEKFVAAAARPASAVAARPASAAGAAAAAVALPGSTPPAPDSTAAGTAAPPGHAEDRPRWWCPSPGRTLVLRPRGSQTTNENCRHAYPCKKDAGSFPCKCKKSSALYVSVFFADRDCARGVRESVSCLGLSVKVSDPQKAE